MNDQRLSPWWLVPIGVILAAVAVLVWSRGAEPASEGRDHERGAIRAGQSQEPTGVDESRVAAPPVEAPAAEIQPGPDANREGQLVRVRGRVVDAENRKPVRGAVLSDVGQPT